MIVAVLPYLLVVLSVVVSDVDDTIHKAREYATAKRGDLAEKILQDRLHEQVTPEERAILQYNLATLFAQEGKLIEADRLFSRIDEADLPSGTLRNSMSYNRELTSLRVARFKLSSPTQPRQELIDEVKLRIATAQKNEPLLTEDILLTMRKLSTFIQDPVLSRETLQEKMQLYKNFVDELAQTISEYIVDGKEDSSLTKAYKIVLIKKLPHFSEYERCKKQFLRAKNLSAIYQAIQYAYFIITVDQAYSQNKDIVDVGLTLCSLAFNRSEKLRGPLQEVWKKVLKQWVLLTKAIIQKLIADSSQREDEITKTRKEILVSLQNKLAGGFTPDILLYYDALQKELPQLFQILYANPMQQIRIQALQDRLQIAFKVTGDPKYRRAYDALAGVTPTTLSQNLLLTTWHEIDPQNALNALVKKIQTKPQADDFTLLQSLLQKESPLLQRFGSAVIDFKGQENITSALQAELFVNQDTMNAHIIRAFQAAISFERQAAHYAMTTGANREVLQLFQDASQTNLTLIEQTLIDKLQMVQFTADIQQVQKVIQTTGLESSTSHISHDMAADLLEKIVAQIKQQHSQIEPVIPISQLELLQGDDAIVELEKMQSDDQDGDVSKIQSKEQEVERPW